jgi:hypothetical protein
MNYFAGLFDAEGYVTLGKDGRFHIGTEVANEGIPSLFKENFGGNIYCRKRDKRKKTWTWVLSTNTSEVLSFISKISAFSIVKQTQLYRLRDYLQQPREIRRTTRSDASHQISNLKNPLQVTKEFILNRSPKIIDPSFWEWFAGFCDGDGNFCVYEYAGKKTRIFDSWISIFNTHPEPICFVQDHVLGSISQYKGSKFPIWKWVCNQKNSQFVCESLYPFLKIKKEQCHLVMDFLEIQKSKTRETVYSFEQINQIRDIINKIKHLNSL